MQEWYNQNSTWFSFVNFDFQDSGLSKTLQHCSVGEPTTVYCGNWRFLPKLWMNGTNWTGKLFMKSVRAIEPCQTCKTSNETTAGTKTWTNCDLFCIQPPAFMLVRQQLLHCECWVLQGRHRLPQHNCWRFWWSIQMLAPRTHLGRFKKNKTQSQQNRFLETCLTRLTDPWFFSRLFSWLVVYFMERIDDVCCVAPKSCGTIKAVLDTNKFWMLITQ